MSNYKGLVLHGLCGSAITRLRSLLSRLLRRLSVAPTSVTPIATPLANLLEWGRANPDKLRAAKNRWNKQHREFMRKSNQRWREANREHVNAYASSYYHANKEHINAQARERWAAQRRAMKNTGSEAA